MGEPQPGKDLFAERYHILRELRPELKAFGIDDLAPELLSPLHRAVGEPDKSSLQDALSLDSWERPDLDRLLGGVEQRIAGLKDSPDISPYTPTEAAVADLAALTTDYVTRANYFDHDIGRPMAAMKNVLHMNLVLKYILRDPKWTVPERQQIITERLRLLRYEIIGGTTEAIHRGQSGEVTFKGALDTFVTSEDSIGWTGDTERQQAVQQVEAMRKQREEIRGYWMQGVAAEDVVAETTFSGVWQQYEADLTAISEALAAQAVDYTKLERVHGDEALDRFLAKNLVPDTHTDIAAHAEGFETSLNRQLSELVMARGQADGDVDHYLDHYTFGEPEHLPLIENDITLIAEAERMRDKFIELLKVEGLIPPDLVVNAPIIIAKPEENIPGATFIGGKMKLASIEGDAKRQRRMSLDLRTIVMHEMTHVIQQAIAKKRLENPTWRNPLAAAVGTEGSAALVEVLMLPILKKHNLLHPDMVITSLAGWRRLPARIKAEQQLHYQGLPLSQIADDYAAATRLSRVDAEADLAKVRQKPGEASSYAIGVFGTIALAEAHYGEADTSLADKVKLAWTDHLNISGAQFSPTMTATAREFTQPGKKVSVVTANMEAYLHSVMSQVAV